MSNTSCTGGIGGGKEEERSIHLLCTLKGAGRFYQELLDALRRRAQVHGKKYIKNQHDARLIG